MPKTNERETVEFQLDGLVDAAAARRLAKALLEADAASDVRVDASLVREFHDDALALLSGALSRLGSRASLRGLRQHQIRILRYLGVAPDGVFAVRHEVGTDTAR